MWRRLRRRSLGPRTPVVWPGQYALATVTVIVLIASAAYALYVVFGAS
jgi:hypothetical protein